MDVSFATRPGSPAANEDHLVSAPGFVVVLDGLGTPRDLGTGCIHGTTWYVHRLGRHLAGLLEDQPDKPLTDLLTQAITDLAASHTRTCDLEHPGTPSTTVAVVRERPDQVDYLLLADSVVLLDGPQGTQVVVDDRIDAVARREHAAALPQPTGPPTSAHLHVQQLVVAQRRHRNRTSGYWIAAADPEAAHHAVTGTLPRRDVRRAAVMTDGAARLVDPFRLATWPMLLDILQRLGPAALIDRVRDAERSDPDNQRWPRIKRHDDATAAFCSLHP